MLVIDEADRILDEGFEESINEILTYLPLKRQTMLFSATLTKSIKRLANVTMKSPEYISLHEITQNNAVQNNDNKQQNKDKQDETVKDNSKKITPVNLAEFYTICPPHEKLDILYSFLKSHLKSKCVVFVSSCKQVRFFFEAFKRLKLGMTFYELHGRQKQSKRTAIFYSFSQSNSSVLFATDVVSRGIDFPGVDWVIQLDCPEDVSSYVHKVGRTARYKAKGNSLLFVSEGEKKFIDNLLTIKGMALKKIVINPKKMISLRPILGSILSENKDIMYLAQKALISYVKSVHMNGNKDVFDIKNIDIKELSLSYGLFNAPEMRIIKKGGVSGGASDDNDSVEEIIDETTGISNIQTGKEKKNKNNEAKTKENGDAADSDKKLSKLEKLKLKIKEKKLKQAEKLNDDFNSKKENIDNGKGNTTKDKLKKNDEDFLKLKRKPEEVEKLLQEENIANLTHLKSKIINQYNNNEDDDINQNFNKEQSNKIDNKDVAIKKSVYYEKIKNKLEKNMEFDIKLQKSRISEKHKKDKLKLKEADYKKHGLGGDSEDEEYSDNDNSDNEDEVNFENENPAFKAKPISEPTGININLKNASLEDKEKAALDFMKNKNSLFKI